MGHRFCHKRGFSVKSGGDKVIRQMGEMLYSVAVLGQFSISRISLGYFPPEHACPCKCSQSLQPIILIAELSICHGLKEVERVSFVDVAILITTPQSVLWECYLIRLKRFYQLFLPRSPLPSFYKNVALFPILIVFYRCR